MGSEELPFSALLVDVVDNRGRTCPTAVTGIPLIATNCVRNDRLFPIFEEVRFVSAETHASWFRGHPKPGDILFVNKGTPGRVALVPDPVDFCIAQDMVSVRADSAKVYPRYLFAVLRSRAVQEQIERLHVGSLIPHFKKGDFDKLLVPVPDGATQRFIGEFYYSCSLRIDLNRRMSETLEAMARALFKSWFVDFDPVRAKAEGRDPALPPDVAGLFPSAFVDSGAGSMPDGWEVGQFSDVALNVRRNVRPEEMNAATPYIALEHMPRRSIALSEWATAGEAASNKSAFKVGEILFGKLRPYFQKVGVAPVDGVCSTDIVVVSPRSENWFGFVLGHVSSDQFVEFTSAGSTGTRMPRTGWSDMARFPVVIPSVPVAEMFTNQVRPMTERIRTLIHESRTLAALRDTLLPKLISGELRIPDAERIVGEVA